MNNIEQHGPKSDYQKSLEAFHTLSTPEATQTALSHIKNILEDAGFSQDATEQIHWFSEILMLIKTENPDYAKPIEASLSELHKINKQIRLMSQEYISNLNNIYSGLLLDIKHSNRMKGDMEEKTMNEAYEKLKSEFKRHL